MQDGKPIVVVLLAGLMLLVTSACTDSAVPTRSDPDGRISYHLPADWEPVPGSSETRFRSTVNPRVSLQINTVSKGSASIQRQRDASLDFQRRSGAEILYNDAWRTPHFEGLSYAHSAEGSMGAFHWHHIYLEGEDYVVATYLQTPPDASETWLPIYREIVASIQPAQP